MLIIIFKGWSFNISQNIHLREIWPRHARTVGHVGAILSPKNECVVALSRRKHHMNDIYAQHFAGQAPIESVNERISGNNLSSRCFI
jgi:hypothetical protein